MIIDIAQFYDTPVIDLQSAYEPKAVEIDFDDCHYLKPVTLTVKAEFMSDCLELAGMIETMCEVVCSRCLEKVTRTIEVPFTQMYDVKGKQQLDIVFFMVLADCSKICFSCFLTTANILFTVRIKKTCG